MTNPTHVHEPVVERTAPHPLSLLKREQVKAMVALILIGTGLFFALAYGGIVAWSSPWWIIYLAIPSLMLLFSAGSAVIRTRKVGGFALTNTILGLLGISISIIMVQDPTWSFTRAWNLDEYFPFLRQVDWDPVWQWTLVVVGVAGVVVAIVQRVVGAGVVGALLFVVGATFLLNLAWDSVWPLVLVALGAGLLFQVLRR